MTDINVCTACYGKGYYSVYSGYTRTGDFVGDQSGRVDGESKRTCPRCSGTGKGPTGVTIDKLQESFSNPDVFVRGEVVEVSDGGAERTEKIYLTTIEGTYQPYVCVHSDFVEEYKEGAPFYTTPRRHIRKLPQQEAGPKKFTYE